MAPGPVHEMTKDEVRVFSPATVSNVGPGFDLMGFALEMPGDEIIIRRNGSGSHDASVWGRFLGCSDG